MAVSQAFIFHFMWYSLLFAVCQLLCWAFLLTIPYMLLSLLFYVCDTVILLLLTRKRSTSFGDKQKSTLRCWMPLEGATDVIFNFQYPLHFDLSIIFDCFQIFRPSRVRSAGRYRLKNTLVYVVITLLSCSVLCSPLRALTNKLFNFMHLIYRTYQLDLRRPTSELQF